MAQFQLKLSKVDATMLGILLQDEEETVLGHFQYYQNDIQRQERQIITKYIQNLSKKLLEFGNDERYEQTEKATKIRQTDFASKIRLKIFKQANGFGYLSKPKRQKILKFHSIIDETEPKRRKNRQVDLLELIEEIEQENQLKP